MTSAEWTAAVSNVPAGVSPDEEDGGQGSCFFSRHFKENVRLLTLSVPYFLIAFCLRICYDAWTVYSFHVLERSCYRIPGAGSIPCNLSSSYHWYCKYNRKGYIWVDSGSVISLLNGRSFHSSFHQLSCSRPEINVLFMNNASLTVMGLATACVPFLWSFNTLIGYACVFGLAMGKIHEFIILSLTDSIQHVFDNIP